MRRAVFLDRDGVLNQPVIRDGRPYPPAVLQDLVVLPGVSEACLALRRAGLLVIVVTNQPDVARGTQRRDVVETMNVTLRQNVPLDDVRVCYHDDGDDCACRKPRPGLLMEAAREWGIDLSGSFMVGDRWKDIEAGRRAGCATILIDWGYAEPPQAAPDARVGSLKEAAEWILGRLRSGGRVVHEGAAGG